MTDPTAPAPKPAGDIPTPSDPAQTADAAAKPASGSAASSTSSTLSSLEEDGGGDDETNRGGTKNSINNVR